MTRVSPPAAGRSSHRGRSPQPGQERQPVATPGPANDKQAKARARLRTYRQRLRTGRIVLPAVELADDEAIAWLWEHGMTISEDADAHEIKATWCRYWDLKFPRQ